jgi:hypothetical protein
MHAGLLVLPRHVGIVIRRQKTGKFATVCGNKRHPIVCASLCRQTNGLPGARIEQKMLNMSNKIVRWHAVEMVKKVKKKASNLMRYVRTSAGILISLDQSSRWRSMARTSGRLLTRGSS